MEFVELTMVLAALLLMLYKPEKERWAFWLVVIPWIVVAFMFIGHVSNALFASMNI